MSKVNSAPTGQALRKRLNQYEVTVEQFAAAGGLSVSSVMRALDPSRPVRLQRKTANRILRAFQILANGRRAEGRREGDVDRSDLVRGLYNTALYVLCQARGLDYDAIRRDGCHTGGAPEQMAARREAVYLTVTGQGVSQAEIGRALGLHKQSVGRMMNQVTDARDEDPALDDELTRLEGAVCGVRL